MCITTIAQIVLPKNRIKGKVSAFSLLDTRGQIWASAVLPKKSVETRKSFILRRHFEGDAIVIL